MVETHAHRAVYGAVAVAIAVALLLQVRLLAAPTAAGFRHALAAAPAGDLYAVAGGHALLLGPQGGRRTLGATGTSLPLALAADGTRLVLGTDAGVEVSTDGGASWRAARVPRGHYPAVWVGGDTMLAGRWSGALLRSDDAGATWRSLGTAGGGEYEAVATAGGEIFAATLTGVWATPDAVSWEPAASATRVTALGVDGAGALVAGDWNGRRYQLYPAGGAAPPAVGAGIWAVAGTLAATTDGIRGGDHVLLPGREVSALVSAGERLYAGVAGGPVLASTDGGASWQAILDG